ncbi:unnamed protein product [Ectocarpus sp. 12 AP-2014]
MEQGQKDGYTLPCRQSRYGVDDGELAGKVDNRRRQCIRWISDERAFAGPGAFRLQPLFACREPCGLTGFASFKRIQHRPSDRRSQSWHD